MTSSATILSIFAIAVAIGAGYSQAASCFPKFKNPVALQNAATTCAKVLSAAGVNMTAIPKAADLEKNHWNDHCLSNCTMAELKMIVNNKFEKNALLAFLKESAPEEALAKLTKIVDECEAISFKHDHDHKDNKKPVVQGKEDKPMGGNKKDGEKKEKGAAGKERKSAPNPDAKNDKKVKVMQDTKSAHNHSHPEMICKQAAKFVSCYQQKEMEAC